MVTLETPTTNEWFRAKIRLRRLERIIDAVNRGYFSNLKLSEEMKEEIDAAIEDLEKARENGVVSEDVNDVIEYLNAVKSRKQVSESAVEKIKQTYSEVVEEREGAVKEFFSAFEGSGLPSTTNAESFTSRLNKNSDKSPREVLEELVVKEDQGLYIKELFTRLWMRRGSGFSYHNIVNHIHNLADENIVDTEKTLGKLRVYPLLNNEDIKRMREGKEQIFRGEIDANITDYFRTSRSPTINVHRFNNHREDSVSDTIYVVAREGLTVSGEVTSIGMYFPNNLSVALRDRYDYRLKPKHEELVDEDAQIAYLVKKGSNQVYVNRSRDRTESLGKVDDSELHA